jgi:hypothetical protein
LTSNSLNAQTKAHPAQTLPSARSVIVKSPLYSPRCFKHVTSRQTVDFPLKPPSAAAFGDDVPVVRPGPPLLQLLAEGKQIKAGKQTDERRGIAIAMRCSFRSTWSMTKVSGAIARPMP